jgi:transporter family protein
MKAIMLAVLAGLCWGVGELFTRSVLHTGKVGPMAAIAVRSTVALPLLWLAWWLATRLFKTESAEWTASGGSNLAKLILGSGVIAGALGMIFFYAALSAGEISRVKPVAFTIAPATAVLLGWLVLGEAVSIRKLAAIALVIGGVILLTTDTPRAAP